MYSDSFYNSTHITQYGGIGCNGSSLRKIGPNQVRSRKLTNCVPRQLLRIEKPRGSETRRVQLVRAGQESSLRQMFLLLSIPCRISYFAIWDPSHTLPRQRSTFARREQICQVYIEQLHRKAQVSACTESLLRKAISIATDIQHILTDSTFVDVNLGLLLLVSTALNTDISKKKKNAS